MNNTPLMRPLAKAILCGAMLVSLQGCVGLMVGGAVAGAAASMDRRTLGAQADDKSISIKADLRLPKVAGEDSHVNATSYNRQVLLTGEVFNEADKAAIEQAASKIDGVRSVVNDLAVMWPSSTSERSRDLVLAGKVKATLIDAAGLSARAFHITVERGAVYLMGRVTEEEAQRAIDLTRSVSGVTKVVRLVEILTPEQLANLKVR